MYHLKPHARLSMAILCWAMGVGALTVSFVLLLAFLPAADAYVLTALLYFLFGVLVTRRLSRDLVEWRDYYGTFSNKSEFTSRMIPLWIRRWPLEISRMAISRL